MSREQVPSQAVIQAIAALEGVEKTAIPPLYEAIDPDALNRVLDGSSATVTFEYYGYEVEVDSSSNVEVTPLQKFDR